MRGYCEFFKIGTETDGIPIIAPDQGMKISEKDLDDEGSGRDELGFMHRIVARPRVMTWTLSYSRLTEEEYQYMAGLFEKDGVAMASFQLFVMMHGKKKQTEAYCSGVSYSVFDAIKGIYNSVSFNIVEC